MLVDVECDGAPVADRRIVKILTDYHAGRAVKDAAKSARSDLRDARRFGKLPTGSPVEVGELLRWLYQRYPTDYEALAAALGLQAKFYVRYTRTAEGARSTIPTEMPSTLDLWRDNESLRQRLAACEARNESRCAVNQRNGGKRYPDKSE